MKTVTWHEIAANALIAGVLTGLVIAPFLGIVELSTRTLFASLVSGQIFNAHLIHPMIPEF